MIERFETVISGFKLLQRYFVCLDHSRSSWIDIVLFFRVHCFKLLDVHDKQVLLEYVQILKSRFQGSAGTIRNFRGIHAVDRKLVGRQCTVKSRRALHKLCSASQYRRNARRSNRSPVR